MLSRSNKNRLQAPKTKSRRYITLSKWTPKRTNPISMRERKTADQSPLFSQSRSQRPRSFWSSTGLPVQVDKATRTLGTRLLFSSSHSLRFAKSFDSAGTHEGFALIEVNQISIDVRILSLRFLSL